MKTKTIIAIALMLAMAFLLACEDREIQRKDSPPPQPATAKEELTQKPEPAPEEKPQPTIDKDTVKTEPEPNEYEEPIKPAFRDYAESGGTFELPVIGAVAWAAANSQIKTEPDRSNNETIAEAHPGQWFTVIDKHTDDAGTEWLMVELGNGSSGWIEKLRCFVNLPDVIPSIVYKNTNASGSIFRSSHIDMPNVTNEVLYHASGYNIRLGQPEYFVPASFPLAQKLFYAQQAAISDGNTIIIYEAFRPHATQMAIADSLRTLMAENSAVRNAINTPPWGIGSFIATSLSNHQRGGAVDTSLAKIINMVEYPTDEWGFVRTTLWEEYEMPSPIHELSPLAATPIAGNEGATLLRKYFVEAGFQSINSEWWHFNDQTSINTSANRGIDGKFNIELPAYNS